MGDVSIWNTKDDLKIEIVPYPGFKIKEVDIHIVERPDEFPPRQVRQTEDQQV